MLAGMVYCGHCGASMVVRYNKNRKPRYECHGHVLRNEPRSCCGINASCLDRAVAQEILRAVDPAAIDIALQAITDLEREQERLVQNWRQNVERAEYEASTAERRYRAVDPENRLVVRTLEQQWETALRKQQSTVEGYERFQNDAPSTLTKEGRETIRSLASNLPEIWDSPNTTNIDKQEVARCLIDRVVAQTPNKHESVKAEIYWVGGISTEISLWTPVGSYSKLEHYEDIRTILVEGRKQGLTNTEIAAQLNDRGYRPVAKRSPTFTRPLVAQLACRLGLAAPRRQNLLRTSEWWLREFGEMLKTTTNRVRYWVKHGYINWRQLPGGQYIVWADKEEIKRLKRLRDFPSSHPAPDDLKSPKPHSYETSTNVGAAELDGNRKRSPE